MAFTELPQLPARHDELVPYLAANPDTSMKELMGPYRNYEAQLREAYAQERSNPLLNDPYLNVVPLFNENTPGIKTRARNLETETPEEKQKYIMALPDEQRRHDGTPAVVESLREFRHNFSIFSESSLADMDWNNVVAAGSSVVNTLLPVPPKFKKSKRALRQYYHEKFCPASDVDLFLYGLNEQQAIEKIKDIEVRVRDAILSETTVVRTKNAITIASQYPTRHIQIVLRVYKSVSEILTGFDIDCSGAAYDGKQVYCTPRALASYITQVNPIDLTRRSPSYENRLSKYSHRNFEVYWPELDRSRVDPTIFERSFQRTLGLARLLVLERLPTNNAREQYQKKRREERGRPMPNWSFRPRMFGNIKDAHEDEVADWVDEDEVSNYHTFTLPYGVKFNAKKIEKLCYTKDLLLNAEWNQPKEREVYLHRHPAFFGRVEDITGDCCGTCPVPKTDEEIEVAEKESEIYISGNVSFRIDDPGRQQIGSFNPLTEDDWTEMAYVGNTARLCHAIVDGDLEHVQDWLSQEGADPNTRDYTGRTPLQLAVLSSTPEIVKCLVDRGARMVARLADGQTALHLAAARGNLEMIRILLERSNANEEEEEEKRDQRRKAKAEAAEDGDTQMTQPDAAPDKDESDEDSDIDMVNDNDTDAGVHSVTTGSFVKIGKNEEEKVDTDQPLPIDEDKDDPDIYNINVLAWDSKCSPLHLAILGGHCEAVKLLCQEFGADALLPIKMGDGSYGDPHNGILTLVLALALPTEKAIAMAETLLNCGATSAQADVNGVTAFHRYVRKGIPELVGRLIETDKIGIKAAINHIAVSGYSWRAEATGPLITAIDQSNPILVLKLLEAGANPEIDFNTWLKSAKLSVPNMRDDLEQNQNTFRRGTQQPLILAIESIHPASALELLERGADPNMLSVQGWQVVDAPSYHNGVGTSALDVTRNLLKQLREYKGEQGTWEVQVRMSYGYNTWKSVPVSEPPPEPVDAREFLAKFPEDSYQYFTHLIDVERIEFRYQKEMKRYKKEEKKRAEDKTIQRKQEAIRDAIKELESVESALLAKGAKTFQELYPDIKPSEERADNNGYEVITSPYSHQIYFRDVEYPANGQSEAYIELFEAAWSGDLEKIKSLTLEPWNGGAPLKVAAKDNEDNTPFQLAFYRGHYDVAGAILEIAKAQWAPREEEKGRYRIKDDEDEDEDEYEGTDDEDQDVLALHKEVMPETITIDNVGEVSMQVKSHIWPTQLVNMHTPTFRTGSDGKTVITGDRELMTQVIRENQFKEFKLLLDWDMHYTRVKPDTEFESEKFYVFNTKNFMDAIGLGRIDMLTEAIKRCGAGMPLEDLVKKSGTELKVKPRYYQGLTVYGKKRSDWANAGRDLVYRAPAGSKTPPLLIAAGKCSIQSVEWFLSDAPTRYYLEFGSSKAAREEPKLKHLHSSPGGFDRAIMKWLGLRNDQIIHSAMLGPMGEEQDRLLEYLIKVCPAALEAKSDAGHTPLFSACCTRKTSLVKILIDAGADQSVKDKDYNNIVHAAVASDLRPNHQEELSDLLSLFDPDLRTHMFQQRNSLSAGGDSPLHHWLKKANASSSSNSNNDVANVATLRTILDFSGGLELDSMNSSGDTVLHTAVLRHLPAQAEAIIAANPRLLYRENAVGRTPPEIAHDRYILERASFLSSVTISSSSSSSSSHGYKGVGGLLIRPLHDFAAAAAAEDNGESLYATNTNTNRRDSPTGTQLTWQTLSRCLATDQKKQQGAAASGDDDDDAPMTGANAAASIGGKRRLVSLNEANDVAKRIGESYSAWRYYSRGGPGADDAENEDE